MTYPRPQSYIHVERFWLFTSNGLGVTLNVKWQTSEYSRYINQAWSPSRKPQQALFLQRSWFIYSLGSGLVSHQDLFLPLHSVMVLGLDTPGIVLSPPASPPPLQGGFIQCQQKSEEYTHMPVASCTIVRERTLKIGLEPAHGLLFVMDALVTQKVSQITKRHAGTLQGPENIYPLIPHRGLP